MNFNFTILVLFLLTVFAVVVPDKTYASVQLYSQADCGPCHEAAEHMRSQGVPFFKKDISDADYKREFDELGGTGTPLILVDHTRLDGYDKNELDQALRKHGYIK